MHIFTSYKFQTYEEQGEQIRCTVYLIRYWNEESAGVRDQSRHFCSLREEIQLLIIMQEHKETAVDLNRTWKITRVDHRGDYHDDLSFEVVADQTDEGDEGAGTDNPDSTDETYWSGNPASTAKTYWNPRLRLATLLDNLQTLIVPQKHEIVVIQ